MRRKCRFIVLIALVLVFCLMLTACEGSFKETMRDLFAKKIEFSTGKYHPNTENLVTRVNADELPLLDGFFDLSSVDFCDSTCYSDIISWAESHPDVKVIFNIPLPDGQSVPYETENIDLSGISRDKLEKTIEMLGYLPKLSSITLGKSSGTEADLTIEDLNTLKAAFSGVNVDCTEYLFTVLGRQLSLYDTELDLSDISSEDVDTALNLISNMPMLTSINLGDDSGHLGWKDIARFEETFNDLHIDYSFELYGQQLNLDTETIDLSFMPITDNAAELREALPYLRNCSYVDMDSCGISNEEMAKLRDEFPGVKIVWRIFMGPCYTVRTDVERVLASKPSMGGNLTSEDVDDLRYCTDIKYLDLGHNEAIRDISFVADLPKLEVLIVAMNPVQNLNGLEKCSELEYLEIQRTSVSDLEPLRGLTKLKHFNLGITNVTDISPLYGLDLERLWIGADTPVPQEQVDEFRSLHPDCLTDNQVGDPSEGAWHYGKTNCWPWVYHERYQLLRDQMRYDEGLAAYDFVENDEIYMAHQGEG